MYTLAQIAHALKALCSSQVPVTGYAIDSRFVKSGDLFFALQGERTDGHNFLKDAAEKQAIAAVVSKNYRGNHFGLELIYVNDVLQALQVLAKKRIENGVRVFAITGSCGKTTTKNFAQTLIGKNLSCYATRKSYNSQATLPLTILEATGKEEVLLLEMGMSRPGELKKLAEIAPAEIALFTKLALQHADAFPDGLAGILREKSEIFSSHTKIGIIPYELKIEGKNCRWVTFSLEERKADYFLSRKNEKIEIFEKGEKITETSLLLPHSLFYYNFLGAYALAREALISCENILKELPNLSLPPMRFEILKRQGVTFLNDAYNANPYSTILALQELPLVSGKRIGVLSAMNALGKFAKKAHEEVGASALQHLDYLLCIGEECEVIMKLWKDAKKPCELFQTKDEIAKRLKEIVKMGDLIFLKGARSYSLDSLIFQESS